MTELDQELGYALYHFSEVLNDFDGSISLHELQQTLNDIYEDIIRVTDKIRPPLTEPMPIGYVAVDVKDLALMINHIGHDVSSQPDVIDATDRAERAINPAALADAEPAPDSGQGETWEPPVKGFDLLRVSESDDETLVTGGLYGDKVIDLPDTPAAEPDRVALPDTPWTTVRAFLDDGSVQQTWVCDGAHTWLHWGSDDRVTDAEKARLRRYEIEAQPPTPDGAETDALTLPSRDWAIEDEQLKRHIADECHRAAKRGRDEALAVVVKALRKEREDTCHIDRHSGDPVPLHSLNALADAIEREAGGDGHER